MRGGLVSPDRYAVRCAGDRWAVCCAITHFAIYVTDHRLMCGNSIPVREEVLDRVEHLAGRSRRMNNSAKFGAVPHAMCEPASELLHFADTIGQIGSGNLSVVAGE
jgi:hypothetical protein